MNGLDFEKPISELEKKIEELRSFTSREDIDLSGEIKKLEEYRDALWKNIEKELMYQEMAEKGE